MNNLCIFVIFNKNGELLPYVEYLLSQISAEVKDLYIVVNGKIHINYEQKLFQYTNQVLIRNNVGYDAGAYQQVIIQQIGQEKFNDYDEIILCNDTFYGFFCSIKSIFDAMREKKADYWGLNYVKGSILDYLESYFYVFQHKEINRDVFSFFDKYDVNRAKTVQDVCAYFELGLFQYLKDKGYRFDYYRNTENHCVYSEPDMCLIDYDLPIVKVKSFQNPYYDRERLQRVLYHIGNKDTRYPLSNFPFNVADLPEAEQKPAQVEPPICLPEKKLLDFITKKEGIYIYGAGLMARKVWITYHKYVKAFHGFIVSDLSMCCEKRLYGYPIYEYGQLQSEKAIVIGLNYRNTIEVTNKLKTTDRYITMWD